MITVEFFGRSPIYGFRISGHSGFGEEGADIICASVSSAAYMAANTVTDVIGCAPALQVDDGDMYLRLPTEDEAQRCRVILDGLRLHLSSLGEQYPAYIKVTYSEV